MRVYLFIVFLFSAVVAKETVKYAAIIYRHGDRTPVDPYPTDPYKNQSYWPERFGELTNRGKQQHFALGQWLRERYSHILSKKFDPREIHVRSTDVDRTLMSAQVNLAGMYPPINNSIWNKDLLWQPIPVHTMPEAEDEVLAMKKNCNAYNVEMQRVIHTKSYKEKLAKYQPLMNYLSAYTGRRVKDYNDISDIYSVLYIESLYNFTLPGWTSSVYPKKMREPACYSFSLSAATPLLARLRAGPLLKDIINNMKNVLHPKTDAHKRLRLSVYSGHDFTVGTILTALDLFDFNCPVYTATIFFELVFNSDTNSHYIKLSYRNSTEIVEPVMLKLPYCGQRCSVERFAKLYEYLLSVDFDVDCNKEYIPAVIGVACLLTVFVLISFCVGFKLRGNREDNYAPLTRPDYSYTTFASEEFYSEDKAVYV